MGPAWVLSAPDGPHVGPMNLAIRGPTHTPAPWARGHGGWIAVFSMFNVDGFPCPPGFPLTTSHAMHYDHGGNLHLFFHWQSPCKALTVGTVQLDECDLCSEFDHDDVIKWKHFPHYWPFARGINWSPVNSPQKGQWRGVLMFSLICAWINGWVNNREAGGLRRHRAHYYVIAM